MQNIFFVGYADLAQGLVNAVAAASTATNPGSSPAALAATQAVTPANAALPPATVRKVNRVLPQGGVWASLPLPNQGSRVTPPPFPPRCPPDMTPMHLQLVSDANGEWAAGLPAARVDPGDTEEMVVVVVWGGGGGRWRWRDGARAAAGRGGGEGRTQAALCRSPHPRRARIYGHGVGLIDAVDPSAPVCGGPPSPAPPPLFPAPAAPKTNGIGIYVHFEGRYCDCSCSFCLKS